MPEQMPIQKAIRNSMLWAAYGDAMGFITELADKKSLKYRTNGLDRITGLVPWKRKLGGKYGSIIELPLGVYSDDTQLRLSVARSIQNDGSFDFEVFSKIELPVFLAYGLGVGRGTKAAAKSLQKPNIQWNTNFFEDGKNRYIDGGGNGGAMRIQPHIWAASSTTDVRYLVREIVRNCIITHGHPIAWIGAIFHGLLLKKTLVEGAIPAPDKWISIFEVLNATAGIIKDDPLLSDIWVPTWERRSGKPISEGIDSAIRSLVKDWEIINFLEKKNQGGDLFSQSKTQKSFEKFQEALNKMDAYNPKVRGSATKTALISSYVAYLYSESPVKGISLVANCLGIDTDTIATMAGALMGTVCSVEPPEMLQDHAYLVAEANRLYNIGSKVPTKNFPYPDLLRWKAPSTIVDLVGIHKSDEVIFGLGPIKSKGIEKRQIQGGSTFIWKFYETNFSQSLLVKTRENKGTIDSKFLPDSKYELFPTKQATVVPEIPRKEFKENQSLDEITDQLIKTGFDPRFIGETLLSFAQSEHGVEKAIAFASIIVKARRARVKRENGNPPAKNS